MEDHRHTDDLHPDDAARALTEIQHRQRQVIDLATIPTWYWWVIGTLMVVLGAGVDTQRHAVIAVTTCVFVLGILGATARIVVPAARHAQLRNGLLDERGVVTILGFVGLIVGVTIPIALILRAQEASHAATVACGIGGIVTGLGGPALMRRLRRIMLTNRAGVPR